LNLKQKKEFSLLQGQMPAGWGVGPGSYNIPVAFGNLPYYSNRNTNQKYI